MEIIAPAPRFDVVAPVQADCDETLIELWLHGRPATTQAAYRRDAAALLGGAGRTLRSMTLGELQGYADSLAHLAPASQARKLAAIKSLCAFGHKLGYLPFDLARPLQLPRLKDRLSERILTEAEVARLIDSEPSPRNHALLRLAYQCGLRISELVGLCWRDLKGAKSGGFASVHGKGGKTRPVMVPPKLWRQIGALRGDAGSDDPVFRSRQGGALDQSAAHRIIKAAAARAGLPEEVSMHYLRHCHISHALDHGAPPHVVQGSVGHASLATTTRYSHVRPGDGSANYLPE